jgi:receptor expression-enhancing protein 1/2/3/4
MEADEQGASYIYRAHLAPFFQEHERNIDVFLASLRTRAGSAFAAGLTWLWTWIRTQLNVRPVYRPLAARRPVES